MDSPLSVSKIVEQHLRYHLDRWNKEEERRRNECKVPSLVSLAADAKVRNLEDEDDINAAMVQMAKDFSFTALRFVLNNPKATYRVLRGFHDLEVQDGRRALDLDEAIIRNEHFLLDRSNEDGKYLVSLEDFIDTLPKRSFINPDVVSFVREDPPKGGHEVLDDLRKRKVQILANSVAFSKSFDQLSGGILRGLNWDNILLAGDMVIFTLLHPGFADNDTEALRHVCLNLFIYGLDSEGANQKVEEIYDTWNRNLPAETERTLIKTPKTLTFRAAYPHRSIQMRFKLNPSSTNTLLSLDLDPCTVAFDGSSVFMLPRCARAIETGYTTFTNELIYSGHLSQSGRLATRPIRLFTYASRGFGLRFLPSFARFLQADQCSKREAASWSSHLIQNQDTVHEQRDRYPHVPQEPGLLTLKRVAYLGEVYLRRLYHEPRQMFIACPRTRQQREAEPWKGYEVKLIEGVARHIGYNEQARFNGKRLLGPVIDHRDLVNASNAVNPNMMFENFEIFSRLCESWRSVMRKQASCIGNNDFLENAREFEHDRDVYPFPANRQIPFDLEGAKRHADHISDYSFGIMARTIKSRLQTSRELVRSDFRDYLTRRIRIQVWGDDFPSISEKQIAMPVLITHELETVLSQILEANVSNATRDFKPLIPVHDPSKYDPANSTLPSLSDTRGEEGNLRYWIISSSSQWDGQSRVMDEITEVLRCLHKVFKMTFGGQRVNSIQSKTQTEVAGYLQQLLSSRYPETLDIDRRDLLLFRQWVLPTPQPVHRDNFPAPFTANFINYPFPDYLFWKEGDEGESYNGKDGVPGWRQPIERVGARNTPAEEFYDPNVLRASRASDDEQLPPFVSFYDSGLEFID